MDVTYIGPHAAVEVETRPRVFTVVKQGETISVTDALAKGSGDLGGLLDQPDNWTVEGQARPRPRRPTNHPQPPNTKRSRLRGRLFRVQGATVPLETQFWNEGRGHLRHGRGRRPVHGVQLRRRSKATVTRIEYNGLRVPVSGCSAPTGSSPVNKGAAGPVKFNPLSVGFGFWLKHMLGTVATGSTSDLVTPHTGTIGSLARRLRSPFAGQPVRRGVRREPGFHMGGRQDRVLGARL
jgi:hypothetical protein